ncbi:MAG: hypothetical protein IJA85_03965 [Clostridia bacterium]|nr:hypothetical protein [Clostridia bacterium]
MKAKSIVALLLAGLMLLSSCSNAADKNSAVTTAAPVDTTPVETEEPKIEPELPDITFDGKDFRFYQYENSDTYPRFDEIWVEDQNGEPINDAVYKRNSVIEEKYKTKITFTTDDYITFMDNVKKYVGASEDVYDVVLPMGHCVAHMYTSNVFYNLHNIEYLDFEKPWWDQNAIESFTLAGYMPFAVSDMLVNDKSETAAIYFNKKLAADYNVGSIYEHVYNNTWTMDKLAELGKMTSEDLNGDSQFNDEDRYGFLAGDEAVTAFLYSAGGRFVSKDGDGYPILSFQSEYNYTAIQYYLETIMYDERLTRNNSFVADAKSTTKMFEEDQGLFLYGQLGTTQDLREMTSDFGIVPVPKYQASQENYASEALVFKGSLIAVPITTQNTEMIGIIVEAMSAESKYTVRPAFYDTVLKDKATRDAESVDMLDIIIDNMVFDVGNYYNLAYFADYFLRITGSVYNSGNKAYPQRTSDIASFYAKYEKQMNKALEDLIETIDEWNEM